MTANDRLIQLKGRLTTYYGEKSVNDKYRDIYFAKYYGKEGGMVAVGKNKKLRVRGKNEKEERKTEENYIKNGEKGIKNASRRKLIRGGKKLITKEVGGG